MSFSSIFAPIRHQHRQVGRISVSALRSLHVSSSVSKKKKHVADEPIAEFDDENGEFEEEADDLFEIKDEESSHVNELKNVEFSSEKEGKRRELINLVEGVSSLNQKSVRSHSPSIRKGTLRTILSLTQPSQGLDEVAGWFKSWRVLGKTVTPITSNTLSRLCVNRKRPDVALLIHSDPSQYGRVALDPAHLHKLYRQYLFLDPVPQLPTPHSSYRYTDWNAIQYLLALEHTLKSRDLVVDPNYTGGKPSTELGKILDDALTPVLAGGLSVGTPIPDQVKQLVDGLKARGGEWAVAVKRVEKAQKEAVERKRAAAAETQKIAVKPSSPPKQVQTPKSTKTQLTKAEIASLVEAQKKQKKQARLQKRAEQRRESK